jgi:glycerophosphoryl diester phosphodiesterase
MSTRPLIIGHRGASFAAPENTLAAFSRALHEGADGIEFDVRLSRDEVPVVIHDDTLWRTAKNKKAVAALSADELSQIDVGSWFNRRFSSRTQSEYDREKLPTLSKVFELFSRTTGILYLEMKCEAPGWEALARQVVDQLHEYSFTARTIVECFHLPAIAHVKRLNPAIRTAALFEPSLKRPLSLVKRMTMVDIGRDFGADEIALHHSLVTSRVVAKAQRMNMPCVVWTVDDPKWIQRATSLGLKALITNNPAAMVTPDKD